MRFFLTFCALFMTFMLYDGANAYTKEEPHGIFAELEIGQEVSIQNEGSSFTITTFKRNMNLMYTVVGKTDTVLVLDSPVSTVKIPVYSVKQIVTMKHPK